MAAKLKQLWYIKHRPASINDYIFHSEEQKREIMDYITKQDIPHLLLCGSPGIGKTTLAQIIINELGIDPDVDVKEISASIHNNVDYVRDTIVSFVKTCPMSKFKIVYLKEADYLSPSAQDVMRDLMEEYESTCRFILTCNYGYKITDAIKSRITAIDFDSPNEERLTEYLVDILLKENVTPLDDNWDVLTGFIRRDYPDVREIIKNLQRHSVDGILHPTKLVKSLTDLEQTIVDYIKNDEWTSIRTEVATKGNGVEWDSLYTLLYKHLHTSKKFKDPSTYERGIITIAEYLYRNATHADKELNFAACIFDLKLLNKEG